ncbi:MAG: response regulator [Bryobacteraceae bacterium]
MSPEPNVQKGQLDILFVENDPATARLTREAFKEAGLFDVVKTVPDGDEALAYLRREEKYSAHPRPDIIFLDLHLPKKSGLQVLKELKSNDNLKLTPVVVISGSADPNEVREAYELHASCYVRKPSDLGQFLDFVQCCFDFWGSQVVFPTEAHMQPASAAS